MFKERVIKVLFSKIKYSVGRNILILIGNAAVPATHQRGRGLFFVQTTFLIFFPSKSHFLFFPIHIFLIFSSESHSHNFLIQTTSKYVWISLEAAFNIVMTKILCLIERENAEYVARSKNCHLHPSLPQLRNL